MNNKEDICNVYFSKEKNPELGEELDIFAHFIGAWDFKWVGYYPDESKQEVDGEWIFSWALEGRVIQDVWIVPKLENRGKEGFPKGEYGTTIRYYNKKEQKCKVIWIGPSNNNFTVLTARKTDDEIVLESDKNATETVKVRWVFSKVKQDSFHWRSEKCENGEWMLKEEMFLTRRKEQTEKSIIERIWHGWTNLKNAKAYEALLKEEIFVNIGSRNIPGYIGIKLLTRQVGDEMEFITIMRFDSIAAVKEFAGEDYEQCVVPEAARKLLSHFDERSQHYELKEEAAAY